MTTKVRSFRSVWRLAAEKEKVRRKKWNQQYPVLANKISCLRVRSRRDDAVTVLRASARTVDEDGWRRLAFSGNRLLAELRQL